MNQKTIAVLFGGCSPEYDVSLASAYSVLCHMDRQKYKPFPVGITPEGDWYAFSGALEKISADQWQNSTDCTPVAFSPSRSDRNLLLLRPEGARTSVHRRRVPRSARKKRRGWNAAGYV